MEDRNIMNVETYNAIVEEYLNHKSGHEEDYYPELKNFSKFLKPNAKILDVGCGVGTNTKFFIERSYDVIGVDAAEKMVEKIEQRFPQCQFIQMDVRKLKFDSEFDGVLCLFVLDYLEKKDIDDALKNIRTVLKPGGVALLAVGLGKGEKTIPHPWAPKCKIFYAFYSEVEFLEKVEAAGFEIVHKKIKEGDAPWPELFVYAKTNLP